MNFDYFQKRWSDENVESDRFNWLTRTPIIRELESNLLSYLPIKEGFNVLEVGCGEGQNIANLLSLYKNVKFYGVDMSRNRIEFAKRNLKGVELFVQDGRELNFKEDSFDVVFCRDVLHHMKEGRRRFMMEMYRVCKKDGSVVMIESNGLNVINIIFSLFVKKESELRKITFNYIKRLLKEIDLKYTIRFVKGYNTQRLIFHYKYGLKSLTSLKVGKLII